MAKLSKTRIPSKTYLVTVSNLKEAPPKFLIPTGNVLLNCALSDNPNGGYGAGKMVNLIGDSSSGKTVLALTMLAEACRDPRFDEYDFIFDDVETALEIDVEAMFGKTLAKRIKFISSDTIEDFYGAIYNQIQTLRPFIWIIDSFDALTSRDEKKRAAEFGKQEAKRKKNEDDDNEQKDEKTKGSWKTEKPKMASEIFRVITGEMKKSDSTLMVISQTRDNLGFGAQFTPKTRSGGKALKFYATHEIWLATGESHKLLKRPIGADCMVKVTKNKLTGKRRSVYFPIYYDYGVDSIESCINFLLDEKHWIQKDKTKTEKAGIDAHDMKIPRMKISEMVKYIEDNNLEHKLNDIVGKVWADIEEKIKLNRKPKYE